MMDLNTNYYRNIAILTAVFAFSIFGFFSGTQAVSAENETNLTPTPNKKKTTPTPKKVKATPTPTRSRTTQKAKATPTPKKNSQTTKTTTTTTKRPATNTRTSTTKKNSTTTKKPTTTTTTNRTTNQTNRNSKTTTTTKKPTTTKTTTTKPTPTKTTTTKPTTTQTTTVLQKIVVNSLSVSVLSSADASASEMTRAKLGSVYSVVEKKSGWYKVQLANQKVGFIPATSVVDSNENGNEEVYRQIVAKNYKAEKSTFAEAVEVYEFLTRIQPEIKTANTAAEFGLKRLLSLRYALNAIPAGKSNEKPYQDFLKAQDENIIFSEPSGEWYVRAPLFWDLYSKYTSTPTGEDIAWEGAKTNLPGECEGYVNCYVFLIRMTDGEYLNYYPNGKNSAQALTNIINFLEPIAADAEAKKVYNGPTDVSDRAEFNSLITELRVIVARMPTVEKEKALQQLRKIAEGFK
ncbi:hypothetical protein BH10ACI1_BH10ACI1_19160 [soil metagenome]